MTLSSYKHRLLFVLLSVEGAVLVSFGYHPILDTSEARYVLVSLRMLLSGDWAIPTIDGIAPFWGKPPLSFWMSALSMKIGGANEFWVRLPTWLCMLATVTLTAELGRSARGTAFGLISGLICATMILNVLLASYVLTDQALTAAVTLAFFSFWKTVSGSSSRVWGHVFFVAVGLMLLTKGLVGIAIVGPVIAGWYLFPGASKAPRLPLLTGSLLTAAIAAPWYVYAEARYPGFLWYFLVGEHLQKYLVSGWTGDLYGVGRSRTYGWIWVHAALAGLPWTGVLAAICIKHNSRVLAALNRHWKEPWLRLILLWMFFPLAFFTFAANGAVAYCAPFLPAVALLCAELIFFAGLAQRKLSIYVLSSLAPASLAVATIYIHFSPTNPIIPTQKAIIQELHTSESNPGAKPVYLFSMPYSAQFYANGDAKVVRSPLDALSMQDRTYFVILSKCSAFLPNEFRSHFEISARANASLILRRRENGRTGAPFQLTERGSPDCVNPHPP